MLDGIRHARTLLDILEEASLPAVLRNHPTAVVPYLVIRDHLTQRLYHQRTGYWQPDGNGLEPATAAQHAAALDLLAGGRERQFAAAAATLIGQGDHALALEIIQPGLLRHPIRPVQDVRRTRRRRDRWAAGATLAPPSARRSAAMSPAVNGCGRALAERGQAIAKLERVRSRTLARCNGDGSPDLSFGTGGVVGHRLRQEYRWLAFWANRESALDATAAIRTLPSEVAGVTPQGEGCQRAQRPTPIGRRCQLGATEP